MRAPGVELDGERRTGWGRVASGLRLVLGPVLIAAVYYAGGVIGFTMKSSPAQIVILWPPNAILLGTLLLVPARSWWLYLAAVLVGHAHLVAHYLPGVSTGTILWQFTGNALQATGAAAALRGFIGAPPRLDSLRRMTAFIVIAAVAAPAVVAALVAYPLVSTGWVGDYWVAFRLRLLTNVFPILTLTPLILLAGTGGLRAVRRASWRRRAEFALVTLGLLGIGIPVFGWESPGAAAAVPALLFAPLPFLIWAAVRFGIGGACVSLLMVAGLSLANVLVGHGPFITLSRAENAFSLQMFLIAMALPLMLLAALTQERRAAEASLRESEARFRSGFDDALVGMAVVATDGRFLRVNRALCTMLGYAPHELVATTFQALTHPEDLDGDLAQVRRTLAGEQRGFQMEKRYRHRRGDYVWALLSVSLVRDTDGRPLYFVSQVQDITERKRGEEALRTSRQAVLALAGRLISAHEEERRRIARELHDGLGQDVAALAIALSNLRRRPATPEPVVQTLNELLARTNDLANSLRALSHDLHPAWIEHVGLVSALKSFVAEFSGLSGLDIALTTPDGDEGIPGDVRICVFRVAQESIRNVARHSGAKRTEVSLAVRDGFLRLVIRDDGRGFDVAGVRQGAGLGLISIEERVRLVRGRATVTSRPGRGTEVLVTIPLSTPERSAAAIGEAVEDDARGSDW